VVDPARRRPSRATVPLTGAAPTIDRSRWVICQTDDVSQSSPPPPPPPGTNQQPSTAPPPPPPNYGTPTTNYAPPAYGQAPPYGQPAYGQPGQYTPGPPGTSPYGKVAGFGIRLGGYVLDSILYGLLFAAFIVPAIILMAMSFDDCSRLGDGEIRCIGDQFNVGMFFGGLGLFFLGAIVVFLIYVRALANTGRTWGRRIVGIKVIRETTGLPLGWGRAIGRTLFAGFISAQIFYIGYLWMLWDPNKQTLHDKVVGSTVIHV